MLAVPALAVSLSVTGEAWLEDDEVAVFVK